MRLTPLLVRAICTLRDKCANDESGITWCPNVSSRLTKWSEILTPGSYIISVQGPFSWLFWAVLWPLHYVVWLGVERRIEGRKLAGVWVQNKSIMSRRQVVKIFQQGVQVAQRDLVDGSWNCGWNGFATVARSAGPSSDRGRTFEPLKLSALDCSLHLAPEFHQISGFYIGASCTCTSACIRSSQLLLKLFWSYVWVTQYWHVW